MSFRSEPVLEIVVEDEFIEEDEDEESRLDDQVTWTYTLKLLLKGLHSGRSYRLAINFHFQ